MRRVIATVFSTLAMAATFVAMPVWAEEGPAPVAVTPELEQIPMGSVAAPAADAEVQTGTTETVPGTETAPALSLTRSDPDGFSSVGLTWTLDPAVADVLIKVRVQDAVGTWGGWTELDPELVDETPNDQAAPGTQRGGTAPYWTGPSTGVEVEVLTVSGAAPQGLELVLIDPREAAADAAPAEPEIQDVANAAASMPPIYSRAQWGADESLMGWDPEYAPTIKAATVHHTADSNNYSAADVPRILRSIYSFHSISRGWGDIGYNVIVDKFGRMWEGRSGGLASTVAGAHAGGFNSGTFGVSMLGNYDVAGTPQEMINAVAAVIAWKLGLYGVNPRGTTTLISGGGGTARYPAGTPVNLPTIFGHRDVGNTTCPGSYGYARLPEIRDRVAAAIGSLPGDASPESVAALRSSSGQMSVFARGQDSSIYVRTSTASGEWRAWTAIPDGIASGPPAVVSYGNSMDIVIRGFDGGYWGNYATFDSEGRPSGWRGWYPLPGGGQFSSAPAIASAGPNLFTVMGRGMDGAVWQQNWTGSRWTGFRSLGGQLMSAPTIHARTVNGTPGYIVYGLAVNARMSYLAASSDDAAALYGWAGTGFYSRMGPSAEPGGQAAAPGGVLTTFSAANEVGLTNTLTGTTTPLGGILNSRAALVQQPDGRIFVFGRGLDNAVWVTIWTPGSSAQPWWSFGGSFR